MLLVATLGDSSGPVGNSSGDGGDGDGDDGVSGIAAVLEPTELVCPHGPEASCNTPRCHGPSSCFKLFHNEQSVPMSDSSAYLAHHNATEQLAVCFA